MRLCHRQGPARGGAAATACGLPPARIHQLGEGLQWHAPAPPPPCPPASTSLVKDCMVSGGRPPLRASSSSGSCREAGRGEARSLLGGQQAPAVASRTQPQRRGSEHRMRQCIHGRQLGRRGSGSDSNGQGAAHAAVQAGHSCRCVLHGLLGGEPGSAAADGAASPTQGARLERALQGLGWQGRLALPALGARKCHPCDHSPAGCPARGPLTYNVWLTGECTSTPAASASSRPAASLQARWHAARAAVDQPKIREQKLEASLDTHKEGCRELWEASVV